SGLNGSLFLDYTGDDSDIVIEQGGTRMTGHVREDNIFATFNDVVDAMNANDGETLHDLLGNLEDDLSRLMFSRSEVGSRQNRLTVFSERHEQETINFQQIRSNRIDLDFTQAVIEYQAAQNVFDASLRTSAQIIPMSLVDFI
ncbi:MAG: hypothetical protein KKB37_01075, partial [Alphaproteobacteria bacterium]|nr:hypothetical protein [Alphaproteobacteria bacterium]